jgi:hypothetical protein
VEQYLVRLWQELIGRVGGHLSFRFILQPLGAAIIAVRAGLKDARAGRPAFGWSVLTDSSGRGHLLRGGRKDLAQLFIIAVVVDLIYEVFVLHRISLEQSLIVALSVAVPPYLIIRGPVTRIARRWLRGRAAREAAARASLGDTSPSTDPVRKEHSVGNSQ